MENRTLKKVATLDAEIVALRKELKDAIICEVASNGYIEFMRENINRKSIKKYSLLLKLDPQNKEYIEMCEVLTN